MLARTKREGENGVIHCQGIDFGRRHEGREKGGGKRQGRRRETDRISKGKCEMRSVGAICGPSITHCLLCYRFQVGIPAAVLVLPTAAGNLPYSPQKETQGQA